MSTFDDREAAFEAKFAHDSVMQFKADARANKRLGLWAAEKLGLSGEEATAYAATVVASDLKEPGDDDVIDKVAADLEGIATREAIATMRVGFVREVKAEIAAD
ncbi:DUF1476 domain-containing protein [Celeribacter arenosi]|uniref:DUF1476 domain-containing protein n=1 Tax=Celeribacter arenosi TaxID=792649 RepID=A0ABP7KIS5_9RHOB